MIFFWNQKSVVALATVAKYAVIIAHAVTLPVRFFESSP